MNQQFSMTQKIAISALFAALSYISFQFLKIPIKLPGAGGSTYFHLGNTFVVLGALMLGGVYGGLAAESEWRLLILHRENRFMPSQPCF